MNWFKYKCSSYLNIKNNNSLNFENITLEKILSFALINSRGINFLSYQMANTPKKFKKSCMFLK